MNKTNLPPTEELSRWTVQHVTNWLSKCSLSVFRDPFVNEGIDGTKLLRLRGADIDQKFSNIPVKKRTILKEHLERIESSRPVPQWNAGPPLPPGRSQPRNPIPPPQPEPEESDDDGSWDEDFDDDIDEDYCEPTTGPPPRPGAALNGQHHPPPAPAAPEEEYEIPAEEIDDIRNSRQHPLRRGDHSGGEGQVAPPPPRPPRGRLQPPSEPAPPPVTAPPPGPVGRGRRPPPAPVVQNQLPPDDVYEVMNDVEVEQVQKQHEPTPPRTFAPPVSDIPDEPPPPPRPKKSTEKPPMPPFTQAPQPGGWLHSQEAPSSAAACPLSPSDDLKQFPWYHGKIGRDTAQKIFNREKKAGMFLVRKSERDPNQPYTLVLWYDRIWNIPIRCLLNGKYAAGKYKEGESQFNSIEELVNHFKTVSLNLRSNQDQVEGCHQLTEPAPRH